MSNNVRSILFISLSNLGDIILTTPVLVSLSCNYPEAAIDVIAGPSGKEIFEGHPRVRSVWIRTKRPSLSERIREVIFLSGKKYDLVVDLKNTMLPLLLRAAQGNYIRSMWSAASRKNNRSIHKSMEHLMKLEDFLPSRAETISFYLPIDPINELKAESLLKGAPGPKRVIAFPGSKSHLKRWPASKYSRVLDHLAAKYEASLILAGDISDKAVNDELRSNMDHEVLDISGKTDISLLTSLVKRMDLMITNDSAPLHMGSALDIPVLAIFGPSDEKKYGPLSARHVTISPDKDCRPCNSALCALGLELGCINDISVEKVIEAAESLLSRERDSA
ncbi:MAG: glycosyltransferase family 9 protein [Candidatus Omnitrophica bacterium]|nr:glycosyltransferase family 9 protein [Candidatus Omnitrophota bacterium]